MKQEAVWEKSVTVLERKLLDSVGKGNAINDISIADLDKLLTILAKLVGIRNENLPDKEESLLVIRSLNRIYPTVKDEELKVAFELCACGQLDCEEHYQSFNFKYISSVINSYIKSVNEANKYVRKEQNKIDEPLFEKEADWTDTLEYLISEYSNGNEAIIPTYMYDWMIAKNHIVLSKGDKLAAMRIGEKAYRIQVHNKWEERPNSEDRAILYELDRGYSKGSNTYNKVVNEAKRYLIKSYILEKVKERKETDKANS